ncbi:MAG: uroporphyrinogen decarboxylase [bacterium]
MTGESRFLRACLRKEVDCTPVWFMRQAGRYLSEYRQLREKYSLLELCRNPELATEVTLQPLRRFDLDAAIIFADILLPLPGIGVDFEFSAGEGPKISRPLNSPAAMARLAVGEPENDLRFVLEAIGLVRRELPINVALIGFAGAPFTLASYMIEGGYSRSFLRTKEMMYCHPKSWQILMEILVKVTIRYLKAQIGAGAQAIQLFDSWVGALGEDDYRRYVLPYSQRIFEALNEYPIPTIHFSTGTAGYLEVLKEAGGSVQSVDWRIPLGKAWKRLGKDVAIQGNLEPIAMMAPPDILERKVRDILDQADGRLGHVFNLGHGFLPQTPVESVKRVVECVHKYSQR